ncbi:MAG: diacylglycerol/lipid kinase family protein [bacterium]
MPKAIGVITNPNSGKNRVVSRERAIRAVLGDRALYWKTSSVEEIPRTIEDAIGEGVEIICVNGGDGAYQKVLSALIPLCQRESVELPLIVPLRGGTMNVLPNNLGFKSGIAKTCRRLLNFLDLRSKTGKAKTIKRPTLKIYNRTDGILEYGYLFANNLIYKGLSAYYAYGKPNLFEALRAFIAIAVGGVFRSKRAREFFRLEEASLTVDGKQVPWDRHLAIIASTLTRMIFGFRPFGVDPSNDRQFRVFSISTGIGETLLNLPLIVRSKGGIEILREKCLNTVASRIEVELSSGYTIDGEIYNVDRPLKIEITPGPVIRFPDLFG